MKKPRKSHDAKIKLWVALLSIALVLIVIFAVGMYQSLNKPPKTAAEYFEVINPTADISEFRPRGSNYLNSTELLVYEVSFTLKAVGGDAHNLIVKGWGNAQPYEFDVVLKGETEFITLTSDSAYLCRERGEDGKFLMNLKVESVEADGTITLHL